MNIDSSTLGTIAAVGSAILGFAAFLVKALIHKTNAPLKDRVEQLENKMTVIEESHKTIIELLKDIQTKQDSIPAEIDKKIKSREEIFDLKYVKKEQ